MRQSWERFQRSIGSAAVRRFRNINERISQGRSSKVLAARLDGIGYVSVRIDPVVLLCYVSLCIVILQLPPSR